MEMEMPWLTQSKYYRIAGVHKLVEHTCNICDMSFFGSDAEAHIRWHEAPTDAWWEGLFAEVDSGAFLDHECGRGMDCYCYEYGYRQAQEEAEYLR